MNITKQLRRLSAFGFLACLRVTDPIWVVFLVARGYSLWQIGLAEGIYHAVSLLCEIPSGIAADLMGRRRSMAVSGLCGFLSAVCMFYGDSFLIICIAMGLSALSGSFISGSDEALLYDSLMERNREGEYIPISARYARWQTVGRLGTSAATFLMACVGYGGIFVLDMLVSLCRSAAALSLAEPAVTQAQSRRQEHPFRDLPRRFRSHVGVALDFLRTHPRAAKLMLLDGLVTLPSYLTLMFLQQRLTELGVPAMWLGVPVLLLALAEMGGLSLGERLQPTSLRGLYAGAALAVGLGTIAAGLCSIVPAMLGAGAASAAMSVWMLHLQKQLNELYPSDQRATLVSVNMMAYSVLMIAASPAVGWIGDITGSAGGGLAVLGAVVLASALVRQA